ncbi:NADH-quinone oxidoreductase subunit D [Candidatus Saganbacteria bacterium]|uniref:NADH-quinone oxidoreductase subunit D n=1 Tax=Candidatus Saganbacteria bacterium TaxID=2575572 RepID=A0A9D6YVN2_UNCSA|nr:NADH-quinone oxidoreductase subunit D [Candidatus Saganbacteria bacterium]
MSEIKTEEYYLSMGPQHPSTHGVLRLFLKLDGEVILQATPDMGYIHRGLEKIAENRLYLQFIPLTDRMDYLASMSNNLAFVLSVEKLAGISPSPRGDYLRVIMAELNRIASHLVWLGTFSLDLGAVTPFLYCFRERERIVDLFEMVAGSRLTYNYMRFGGVAQDVSPQFVSGTLSFLKDFNNKVDEYESLLTENPIFLERTKKVGIITPKQAAAYGLTGPILRASGIKRDLRKNASYSVYRQFSFEVPVGEIGDCWDRYIIRMKEMRESVKIIEQAIAGLPEGAFKNKVPLNLKPPEGEAYVPIESPRGELGFYIISKGANKPYRLKIRAPSFCNLSIIGNILKGWKVADVVTILGTFDIVLGEIDR